ncbi:septal ring lytic transglycosylase RlpA family protein [Phenylobacterium sp.]|uniref:septal ring lytic transglycosylase RlpA family protein n=1 Tax=Phenylobacterium sp. TaxID=1871053 RepID=UPI00286EAD68|nr:septal ring lytic transglycosylase RlpA family protein [Phenylobacterium sp.]
MNAHRHSATARNLALVLVAGVALAACATPQPRLAGKLPDATGGKAPTGTGGRYKVGSPYQVAGVWYVPHEDPHYNATGTASWYGADFHMKPTANGETFDMNAVSAAHPTLPLPSMVEVTNLDNGKTLQVRVNDRGPFVGGRVIDLSHEAARQLGYDRKGLANVRVKYVGLATLGGPDPGLRYASSAAAAAPPPAYPAPLPAYTPPAPVAVAAASLPPITGAAIASSPIPPVSSAAPVYASAPAVVRASAYRVQAGAFSDRSNAQRVADQLSTAGQAVIEPVQRPDGVTLYRVVLQGGVDEGEAWGLRDKVASYGFAEARVLRPF